MEEDVVVVEEKELSIINITAQLRAYSRDRGEDHVFLVVGVVDIEVGHVIIPLGYTIVIFNFCISLTIVGVQEHGIEGELGSDSLADIEQVEHLLN